LTGGSGDDLLVGGAGADTLAGGIGSDTVTYAASASSVIIDLGNGNYDGGDAVGDVLSGIENVIGTGFADVMIGSLANNVLTAGAGNDTLDGRGGNDTMVGGAGHDFYVVDATTDVITELLNEGTDQVESSVNYTLSENIENLTLTGGFNRVGTGNALANLIIGNSAGGASIAQRGDNVLSGLEGNDTIFGFGGNDTLDGGTGVDSLVGGDGSDVYVVDMATDVVLELSGEGVDTVVSSVTWVLGTFFENLTLTGGLAINGTGTDFTNMMVGNDAANLLMGLLGNDTIIANGGNDTLDGGIGADSMRGGLGDDTYLVDDAGDVVTESTSQGTDIVLTALTHELASFVENLTLTGENTVNGTGNSLANVITGNAVANGLFGGTGNDTLYGMGGDDTLEGGLGIDSLLGGAGDDLYLVDAATDFVVEAAGEGIDTVLVTASWTLSANVEHLTLLATAGYAGIGNTLDNRITGNTGSNALSGLEGNDTLDAGTGSDTLNGGTGADSMIGGAGDDTYVIDNAGDVVVELADGGVDTVQSLLTHTLGDQFEHLTLIEAGVIDGTGNGFANVLTGNESANLLSGLVGNDTLVGNGGNDTLDGGTGADSMVGGSGDDVYRVDDVGDKVVESSGGGTDTIESSITQTLATPIENLTLTGSAVINATGNTSANILTGNLAANILTGGSGNDTLFGGAGNDTLIGGSGDDVASGGLGDDLFIIDSLLDVVIEAAASGTDTVQTSVSWSISLNFEHLTLTGTLDLTGTGNNQNNRITGNTGNNVLAGGAGADTLDGGEGDDTVYGGSGADNLIGGGGDDTYFVDFDDVLVELAGGGTDTVQSSISYTLSAEFERLNLTGAAISGTGNEMANALTGNQWDNLLTGLGGNDTLTGGGGSDTLDGGAGNDSMRGGAGDDLYRVDSLTDRVVESVNDGIDTIESSITLTLAQYTEHLTLVGEAAINGTGTTGANRLVGNGQANVLSGGAGVDTLIGGAGNDTLIGGTGADLAEGGTGDDVYVVESALDIVVELAEQGIDRVESGVTWTLGSEFENLTLTGTAGLSGTGNAAANTVIGNSGSNILSGLDGDDVLRGMRGNDTLNGGAGADQFVFAATLNGTDTISDFNALDGGLAEGDLLLIEAFAIGTFVYVGGAVFSGGSDNTEARVQGNQVQFDLNGDGVSDFAVTLIGLTNANQLTEADFLFN